MTEETARRTQSSEHGDSFFDAWQKQLRVINHVLAHAVAACAIGLVVTGVAWFLDHFAHHFSAQIWLAKTPYAFTIEDLVQISDLFILIAFLVSGSVSMIRELFR